MLSACLGFNKSFSSFRKLKGLKCNINYVRSDVVWRDEKAARFCQDDVEVLSARCLSEVKYSELNLVLAQLDLSSLVYNQVY